MKVMAAKIAAEGGVAGDLLFPVAGHLSDGQEPQIKKNAELHLRLVKVDWTCES